MRRLEQARVEMEQHVLGLQQTLAQLQTEVLDADTMPVLRSAAPPPPDVIPPSPESGSSSRVPAETRRSRSRLQPSAVHNPHGLKPLSSAG